MPGGAPPRSRPGWGGERPRRDGLDGRVEKGGERGQTARPLAGGRTGIGSILAILVVTVGAVEMAIGLALVLLLYRQRRTSEVDAYADLKR